MTRIKEYTKCLHHITYDNIIIQMIKIESELDKVMSILGEDIEK